MKKQNHSLWIPILLIFFNLIANLANDIYLPIMPELVKIFDISPNMMQLTVVAWFSGIAFPQLLLGPLSDWIGRRPVIVGGGICLILASIICMFSSNIEMIIVGRFFQGIGVCSVNIASFSVASDIYVDKQRVRLLTYITMCSSISPLLGPFVGSNILVWFSWQIIFLLVVLLAGLNLVGIWYKLPETNFQKNSKALHLQYIYKYYASLIKNNYFLKHTIPYCLVMGGLIAYLTAAPFIVIEKFMMSLEYFSYIQFFVFGSYIISSLFGEFW